MRIFPYKKYVVETDMPKGEAIDKFIEHTKILDAGRQKEKELYFKGEVYDDKFDVKFKRFFYSNSRMLFSIRGEFLEEGDSTKIPFSVIFPTALKASLIISHLGFAVYIGIWVADFSFFLSVAGAVAAIFLINLGMYHIAYRAHTKRTIKFLTQMYQNEHNGHFDVYEDLEDDYKEE